MQCCTFRLAGALYGIDVLQVQEIIRRQGVTPVPLSPEAIDGLINLRGKIVATVCLRRRLGLPPRDPEAPAINVIVRHQHDVVSVVVDAISDVIEFNATELAPSPDTIDTAIRPMLAGVVPLAKELLLVIDVEQTLALASV